MIRIEELLDESMSAARKREQSAFDEFAGEANHRIVLCGAGNLGRKMLAALRRRGTIPLAFADNDARRQGHKVEGIPVLSATEAARRYGTDAVFVVSIFRGTGEEGMCERLAQFRRLGCTRVTSFLPLAWNLEAAGCTSSGDPLLPYYGADLPSRLLERRSEFRLVSESWSDATSVEIFRQQLLWRLRADFSVSFCPTPDQYFPSGVLERRRDERLVDGGAYDGDTLRAFGAHFSRAWAIEPDPANASRLRLEADARTLVIEAALGKREGRANFSSTGAVFSALRSNGEIDVQVTSLDAILADEQPTFIKLDIEGAELDALQGAYQTMARSKPVMAVCVYHRPDHLWEIPKLLRAALPQHRCFLRGHQFDGYELVAYAVPPERLVRQ